MIFHGDLGLVILSFKLLFLFKYFLQGEEENYQPLLTEFLALEAIILSFWAFLSKLGDRLSVRNTGPGV